MKQLSGLNGVVKYIHQHPLAGKHRLVAYSKFVAWQLSQLIKPGEKIVPFVGKTCLAVTKGMTGATGNIYLGLHDFYEMGFLLHFLREDDLFADIGANIGSYTILAAGVSGANAVAFEPVPTTFANLEKNISINQLGHKVRAYNAAIGGKVDKLFFTAGLDTVNHVIPDNENERKKDAVVVPVDTLDNVVQTEGVPAMIKIDVEGYETEVIRGMETTLANETLKAIVVELNGSGWRYGYDENEIHKKLLSHGFMPHSYDPFTRRLTPHASYGEHNTLYLRDIDFVKQRVEGAKKITVFNESF